MIQIFRTDNYQINKLTEIVPDSWIHLVAPTEEEIALVSEKLSLEPDFLRAALDEEERSRLGPGHPRPFRLLGRYRRGA